MKTYRISFPLFLLILSLSISIDGHSKKIVSPNQHGLKEANTDLERYWVLFETHKHAKNYNLPISYKGIDTIRIEIPNNAQSLPLTDYVDFSDVVLVVKNNLKNFHLFNLTNLLEDCDLSISELEKQKHVKDKGQYLVIVEDETPWVKERRGYSYGHIRKDILYVNNGKVEGEVVSTYTSTDSRPYFKKCYITKNRKTIKNLTFIRDSSSIRKTQLFAIENEYNIRVENVRIVTPHSDMYADVAMYFGNCYKVDIRDVIIDGTYSNIDAYGYGISLNNVSHINILKLKGNGEWGLFGNNNVSNVTLKKCDINRFDVHCYGRDIYLRECIFKDLYNQFSSIYGELRFKKCTFREAIPILFESSYNAYSKFNIFIDNCTIYASKNKDFLIHGGGIMGEASSDREELRKHEYPFIYINGLKVYLPKELSYYKLYNFSKESIISSNDSSLGIRMLRNYSQSY